jgi:hypothetical protein
MPVRTCAGWMAVLGFFIVLALQKRDESRIPEFG